MKSLTTLLGTCLALVPMAAFAELHVVVVEGLSGEPRYAEQFAEQVTAIDTASKTLTSPDHVRVFRSKDATRDAVLAYFESLESTLSASDQLVVYLIGHGSYDEYDYKFNIKGPDLTGADLARVLEALPSGKQLLVNTSSASGAVADLLESEDRLLILATRSGVERHATRFGTHFAAALTDPEADIDKNQMVTAKEAFSYAERRVSDHFERNGQLSTEHARIDGAFADRFPVARLSVARTTRAADRELVELIESRDALNAKIDALRLSRDQMSDEDYRTELLGHMLGLARLEDSIEQREREIDNSD